MTTYYKATRPNGHSFNGTPPVSYTHNGAPRTDVIRPAPHDGTPALCGPGVLHVADTPTETLAGGSWPCRLFVVEPVGDLIGREGHKFGFGGLRIVREVEAWRALGPQGREVAALIDRAESLTPVEVERLTTAGAVAGYAAWAVSQYAARDAARNAAWAVARYAARVAAVSAAWVAARYAAWDTSWGVAGDAAIAITTRDLIGQHGYTQTHYDTLTASWRQTIGSLHPDDPVTAP